MTARAAKVVAVAVGDGLDLPVRSIDDDVLGDQLGAEALGLRAQLVHQLRAHDPVGEAGEVLHVGGVHQRAAGGDRALEDQRLQVRPGRIDGGGVPGRPAADDDDVPDGSAAVAVLAFGVVWLLMCPSYCPGVA